MAISYWSSTFCDSGSAGPNWEIDDSVFGTPSSGKGIRGSGTHNLCYRLSSAYLTPPATYQTPSDMYGDCTTCEQDVSPTPTPTPSVTPSPSVGGIYTLSLKRCCDNVAVNPTSPFNFSSVGAPTNNDSVIVYNGQCHVITNFTVTTGAAIAVTQMWGGGCKQSPCLVSNPCPSPSPTPTPSITQTPTN